MSHSSAWGSWDSTDDGRRASSHVLDTDGHDMHSALVPPGALHHRVTAALANWQLDDAEELLAGVDADPSPYAAPDPDSDAGTDDGDPQRAVGRAWSDTLRAELLVRRLRKAGYTLVGDPVDDAEPLDLHAGVAGLIEGGDPEDARSEQAARAALAIALVRSAKAAFDASDDDLQRAAGLARHARIELLSRRIDAAMDEAVEAASLLDPMLAPSALLIDTLTTLARVLADLELMPLGLDYQRRAPRPPRAASRADLELMPLALDYQRPAHESATAAAADPGSLGPDDGDPDVLVASTATCLGELCAEVGEGLLDDGLPESAAPYFAEARQFAEESLALLPPESPGVVIAQV